MQDKSETQFSSNAIRLKSWEWMVVAVIIIVLSIALPSVWRSQEGFSPSSDYRIPYDFSEDYWLYKQYCQSVSKKNHMLVLGDSVIWGHYVGRALTLSHYLNELAGEECFINLGLDGSHPMALLGLVRHYGKAIRREKVILHLNLLWLSSQEADLQTEKELHFNHPRLVPQFNPRIPCYHESISGRIGILLERCIPILQMVRHLQVKAFDNSTLQLWTMEYPYSNPLSRISIKPIGPAEEEAVETLSAASKGSVLQSLPWVEFETSLQWWAFQRLIELLVNRNNDVSVIVGPLNEHVLDSDSIQKYQELLKEAEDGLEKMNIPYSLLPLLPKHLYADTSHPIAQGYALLAEYVWKRLK